MQRPDKRDDSWVVDAPKQAQRAVPAAHADARERETIAVVVDKAAAERERGAVAGAARTSSCRVRGRAEGIRIEAWAPQPLALEHLCARGDLAVPRRWVHARQVSMGQRMRTDLHTILLEFPELLSAEQWKRLCAIVLIPCVCRAEKSCDDEQDRGSAPANKFGMGDVSKVLVAVVKGQQHATPRWRALPGEHGERRICSDKPIPEASEDTKVTAKARKPHAVFAQDRVVPMIRNAVIAEHCNPVGTAPPVH
jgi:hypothetical protein